jgi:hypothetical protein
VEKLAKRKLIFLFGSICILLIVAGYINSNWSTDITDTTTEDATTDTSTNTDHSSSSATSSSSSTMESETSASNNDDHKNDEDFTWDSTDVIKITLNMDSISVDDEKGTTIDGTTVTIASAGTYSISGTLNDGQVIVDTDDEEVVRLILNGITMSSTTNAPIYIANADETVIVLADGTENYLTDDANNEEDAALLSRDDLVICGDGALTVSGNANDAIRSNDGLVIESGTITVTSVDDGIRGKDYLVIKDGDITVNSVGDGLKSDNDEDENKGNISIEDVTIDVTSTQGDAITAQNDLLISDGTFTLTSGGGSDAWLDESISTKGLKAGVSIVLDGGTFTISSFDDAIHSNDVIVINNGTFDISSGDDGIHADTSLEINGGTFNISKSFEGMESAVITINDGYIQITSSDDGINSVESNVDSSTNGGTEPGGVNPSRKGRGGFTPSESCYLYINGGFIVIDSYGDGIDSNGYIEMSDGVLIINGPTVNNNAAIDYGGGSFKLTGGTLVAVGSSGMAQAPSTSSTQYSANLRFSSTQSANTLVNIQAASGEDVLTFRPIKTYQSLVFSSPELAAGKYNVYVGGSSTGTPNNGLYEDGTYSGGTYYGSFTLS